MDPASLFERIARMPDEELEDDDDPAVDPEAAIVTYAEIAERYARNQFKVGDIVTPRKGYGLSKVGVPCVVVESLSEPIRDGHPNPGSKDYYPRLDVRVIRMTQKGLVTLWYESWQLEEWQRKI